MLRITETLVRDLANLRFGAPVTHVYNPLIYAQQPYRYYLERYGRGQREIVLVGMNPGPWGMAQTGVPFGEVSLVREWLGIDGIVRQPERPHPKRPVEGFACRRSEASGRRLWGWARARFGTPECFFARFFVLNYCPLLFFNAAGQNITPDKLPAAERVALFACCDRALHRYLDVLAPRFAVGVGTFAESRIRAVLADMQDVVIARVPHPSPASPMANRGWDLACEMALLQAGVSFPFGP